MTELRLWERAVIGLMHIAARIFIALFIAAFVLFVAWEVLTGGFYTAPEPYRTIAAVTPITLLALFAIADHYWGLSDTEGDQE